VFTDTLSVGAGAVKNATAIGRAIVLDPREPPDDLSQPFWVLRYPPITVWVEPVEAPVPLGQTCGPTAPPNCMPLRLVRKAAGKTQQFSQPVHVGGVEHRGWRGHREAFPLGDGFAVTDFYAQGQSFGREPWYAHLARPDTGGLKRASVLVTLTRFRDWDAVLPWAPLWPDGDQAARAAVIKSFCSAARPSEDLQADLQRMHDAEAATLCNLPLRVRNLLRDD
jgi:hypothetical protein